MTERRFSETEADEIFRRAAEMEHSAPRALAGNEGMTLVELQRIGQEAGLAPDLIAQAAVAPVLPEARLKRSLGLPIGVQHTVELDRTMPDREWELLVGELRETFDARGTLQVQGSFRSWSNGNLQVLVEPTERGSRVRFRTTNSGAQALIMGGTISLVFAGVTAVTMLFAGVSGAPGPSVGLGVLGIVGVTAMGLAAARLRGWSRTRSEQMRALGERLLK